MNQLNRYPLEFQPLFLPLSVSSCLSTDWSTSSFSWLISVASLIFRVFHAITDCAKLVSFSSNSLHSMVALVFCGLLTALWLQDFADCLSSYFRI